MNLLLHALASVLVLSLALRAGGVALEAIGRGDDAGRVYAEVLAADPGQPDALWRRGVLRWQAGARDLAVAD